MHMTDEIIVWAGTPESAREYLERTQLWKDYEVNGLPESVRMLALSGRDEEDEDERFGAYAPFIRTVENTAVIPINGSLHSKENFFTQFFGIMTYETLSNIMALLAGDEDIKNALLSFSTPGGSAMGIDVATDAIHAMRRLGKPVYGHTADHSLSAGYWIASACETFNCQKNAEIGSVGVIGVHADMTSMLKKEGIRVTVMRKGEEKALATPYEKLSDKARAQVERSMGHKYDAFIEQVSNGRRLERSYVMDEIATGRVFTGQEAQQLRLVDEIVPYNDEVARIVSQGSTSSASSQSSNSNWSEAAMHKKPIINISSTGTGPADEAMAAVAAGVDPENLQAPDNLVKESTEDKNEEKAEVAAEASSEKPETESAEETQEEQQAEQDTSVSTLLADLNQQLVDAKVQLNSANTQLAELQVGNAGLRKIAVEQTQRLRVALGQPASTEDLDKMSDTALITAHEEVRTHYLERFNIGATSRVPEKDTTVPHQVVTRLDQAARKATNFK